MTARPTIVIATRNAHKTAEFSRLLSGWHVLDLSAFHVDLPDETGSTFVENALVKAVAASSQFELPVLGDDSGLCVDALGGAPGIWSARFAGLDATDQDNRSLLISKLHHTADDRRGARFVCALALGRGGQLIACSEGECHGIVGRTPSGENGFGYDPIFQLEDGRSFADLTDREKDQRSHRAAAVRALEPTLRRLAV